MALTLDNDALALGRVLATIPQFLLVVDGDGVITYINRVEPGYERSKVLGMPAADVVHAGSRHVFEAAFKSVLETGEGADYEVEIPMPDGSMAWYQSQMFPFEPGIGRRGVVIIASNVTELKAAQQSAAQLRQLLPICAWCDRIQSSEGNWETIPTYLDRTSETKVTHGMCPDCYRRQDELLNKTGAG